jgi:hypothetical protein
MLQNERRSPDARLRTFDWFNIREPLDLDPATFEFLMAQGRLSGEAYDEALKSGSFLPIFRELHAGQEYTDLVVPEVGYLPGHRDEQANDGAQLFRVPWIPWGEFSLVFVDGCKSWYGTKYWLSEICEHLPVGAQLMFQDFGWYTCFWLPSLIGALRDHFRPSGYVDHTYAFEIVKPITPAVVDEMFPDEPMLFDRTEYDFVFDMLLGEAEERGDARGMAALTTQRAAAYAYIGLKDEARAIIDKQLARADYMPIRPYLQAARLSPTYYPDGTKVTL